MKRFLRCTLVLLAIVITFTKCKKTNSEKLELIELTKVITVDEMRTLPVGITKPMQIAKSGKIYSYNNYLFINEPHKGIHIYNNSNPSAPINVAFLKIPGNVDLAISNNILYADSYVDLLAFDISAINNIRQVKRLTDVFKQFYLTNTGVQKYVLTYKDTLINKASYQKNELMYSSVNSSANSSGQGGSMARFTLSNNHLYTVGANDLSLFNVQNASDPSFVKSIALGWGVETIFPYENKLFIGTNNGMHIFNATDPGNPVKLSTYSHVFACDPVVVQGRYAYVTLRTGNFCRQATNQLEVVDIEDPTKPKQIAVFPMQNPHGLSVSGTNLFLCEGPFGLKTFDITNKNVIGEKMLQHLPSIKSFDVIAGPKSLIVTGEDGVYQFNYSNAANLSQLSKIKVQAMLIPSIFK